MQSFKKGKVEINWLEDEMVWEIISPIGIMSGHTPIIDWPMGWDIQAIRDLADCLNQLADLELERPEPLTKL